MRLFETIKSLFKPKSTKRLSSSISEAFNLHRTSSIADLTSLMQNWVFVCINRRAKALAGLKVYASDLDGKYLDLDHWLNRLITSTNRYYSFNQLIYLISSWLDTTGNAYVYCDVDGVEIAEMYCLPANSVTIKSNAGVISYEVRLANHNVVTYTNEQVIHLKTIKPANSWDQSLIKGSPYIVESIANTVLADKHITRTLRETAERGGVLPFTLMTDNSLSNLEYESFKQQWQQSLSHYPIVALLENGMRAQPLINSNALLPPNVEDMIIKRIAAAFDIPPKLLTNEYNAEATARVIERAFYTRSILPLAEFIYSELNRYLSRFGVKLIYENPLLKEPEEMRRDFEFMIANGLMTINEVREELGFEPVENGDVVLVRNQYHRLEDIASPISPQSDLYQSTSNTESNLQHLHGAGVDTLSRDELEIVIASVDYLQSTRDKIKSLEAQAEEDAEFIKKVFSWNAYNRVTERYRKQMDTQLRKILDELKQEFKSGLDRDAFEIDTDYWTDVIYNSIAGISKQHCRAIIKRALKDVSKNPQAFETAINRIVKEGLADTALKVRETTTTISAEIMEIARRVAENEDLSEAELTRRIKKEITRYIDTTLANRIDLISRTATTAQRGISQRTIWEEAGYDVIWLSSRDARVRDSHAQVDGQRPDENGYFHVGLDIMRYPASGSIASENCNCRCMLYPVGK